MVDAHSFLSSLLSLSAPTGRFGRHRCVLREWLPGARAAFVTGDFNGWSRSASPMRACTDADDGAAAGVFEYTFETPPAHLSRIKLHVIAADGRAFDRVPSRAEYVVVAPSSGTMDEVVWAPPEPYRWRHPRPGPRKGPLLIYEAHVGIASADPRVATYREFADNVLPRIAALGYNAVQLMAVAEHSYYASFGYQVTSFFAASSRSGTPDDLRHLCDTAHGLGLCVLMDLVHSHASRNVLDGLGEIDGSETAYFHAGARGYSQWNSRLFDYGKPATVEFLLSNIRFLLEQYRFDGFRFDAVGVMLYPEATGVLDQDAHRYLQLANLLIRRVAGEHAITLAEDVTGYPGTCRPVREGGLGFDYRMAMHLPIVWIHTASTFGDDEWPLSYVVTNLTRRAEPTVAYVECHDQSLVGDKTLACRLIGDAMYTNMSTLGEPCAAVDRGVALLKIIRVLTLALGGDAWLNFMGNEFGHPEWLDFPRSGNDHSFHFARRRWDLVDDPLLLYAALNRFDRALLAAAAPCMVGDWSDLAVDDATKVVSFVRNGRFVALNFDPTETRTVAVPRGRPKDLVLDTDAPEFGGCGRTVARDAAVQLAPRSGVVLRLQCAI